MKYLTGWAEPGHERLVGLFVPASGDPVFLVPRMNAPQAVGNPAGLADVRGWTDEASWQGEAETILGGWDLRNGHVAIDDELHSVHLLDLQRISGSARWTAAGQLMSALREVKDEAELDAMRRSSKVTDDVVAEIVPAFKEGVSELDIQLAVETLYRKRGTKPEFALVCFGENSAMPHHHTGSRKLEQGDVIILDIGCLIDGYASDITRTFAFGKPDPEAFKVYDTVLKGHQAAFAAGRPGATPQDVDRAARKVITDAGYGEYFVHRTGHGIGLSTHEPPSIVEGNDVPLKAGMCFTDEPGIYLPGRFGVRIENVVTVTESGLESLNAAAPDSLPII
jgi:D-alanyl-D-alanine dipeptidase